MQPAQSAWDDPLQKGKAYLSVLEGSMFAPHGAWKLPTPKAVPESKQMREQREVEESTRVHRVPLDQLEKVRAALRQIRWELVEVAELEKEGDPLPETVKKGAEPHTNYYHPQSMTPAERRRNLEACEQELGVYFERLCAAEWY